MAACSGLPQVTRLSTRMHYEDIYRLCYVRGPEGINRRAGGADRLRAPAGVPTVSDARRRRLRTEPAQTSTCL
jgi:hypothetical protein